MSNTNIPVIKYLFKEDLKVLSDALNIGPGFEIQEFGNSNDLSTYLSSVPAGLVITSLHDRNDLIQIATYMKLGKKLAKDCAVKIVVINFSKDRNFEKAVAKLGILDVVEPGINTKALKFKIDFWMKSLNAQVKNNIAANPQKVKSLDQNKSSDKKAHEASVINWLDPLDLEEDIWLLKHDNDCKKVLSKWLLRLLGPSPYVGQWTEVKAGLWRFDIKESEKDIYVSSEGAWFFSGDQKPEFVWKENIWLISGDNFDLFFKGEEGVFSRLNCKNKIISVCKNSEFAKTKEQVIIESFDKELVFKREAELLKDLEGKNKTDQLNNGNLEGKNKTDEIDGGPLEGKSKSPADRSGNLTGKMEGQESINQENLDQKSKTTREKTHWNNKNSYEEEKSKSELSVNAEKHKSGDNLERENKDNEHKKYYKNHNEAEKYEAGELGSGLSGKSSVDQLSSHYDNKKKTGSEAAPGKEKELSGKSDTDKLKAHYGRKENTEAQKENESKGFGGKSSTDKIASHYGKPNNEASTAEAKERAEKPNERNFEGAEREKSAAANSPEREKAAREEKTRSEREEKEKEQKSAAAEKERERPGREVSPEAHEERNRGERAAGPETQERIQKAIEEAKALRETGERAKDATSAIEKALRKEKPVDETKTKKQEHSNNEESSQKTGTEKSWEGEHDYGFKGDDPSILARRKKEEAREAESRGADVFPLNKMREEKNKQKSAEEKELDKITEDARVISILTLNNRKIECGLDDFFDETIIFHTDDPDFSESSDVSLDLKFKFLKRDTQLKINGSVLSVENDGEGKNFVTVQLSKENAVAFDSFMKLYEIRQQNVTEFLKKAKGF